MILFSVVLSMLLMSLGVAVQAQDTVLTIIWWGSQNRHDRTIEAINLFEEQNPDINIEYEFSGWDDYWTRVNTQADAANTPLVSFDYDIAGNRLSVTENNGTSNIRITGYSYDEANRLKQVDFDTDGDGTTIEETVQYNYDIAGLRTELIMPGGLSIHYTYDQKGRLISLEDWDNQVSEFHYDKLNRHRVTRRANGMRSIYTLDAGGRLQKLRHENKARELLAEFRYLLDGRGNRTQARELFDEGANSTTRTVDYLDPTVQTRATWSAVSGFYETTDWEAALSFEFVGNVNVELDMGEGPDHSIYDVYIDGTLWQSFDGYAGTAATRTIDIPLRGDGWHTLQLRNRHEQNLQSGGYKLRFKELRSDSDLTERTIDYGYDSLSRLLSADYDNGAAVYNYGYDEAGNLVNMDGTTRTYNAANQMTNDGTNSYDYDDNGNLWKNNSVVSHTWDRANRLLSHGGIAYAYDGAGNRISQNTLKYLLDVQPGLTVVLGDSNGNHFVHGIRGIHAVDDGTDWTWFAQDGLGSVRGLFDDAAVVQSSMSYDPYGNPMGSYGAGFGFTGEQTDANDLLYLRARYYEPGLGVFSALDPFEGIHGRPMSLNGYSWVEGNVPNAVDPSGMQCTISSFDNLLRRKDKLITLARKWNSISIADCYHLTGIDILDSCGFPACLATDQCRTGLSDEAFVYVMASILHQEARLRPWRIDIPVRENLQTLYHQISGGHNSSEGIAQIRPETAQAILRGFLPTPNGSSIFPIDTERLEELRGSYINYIEDAFNPHRLNPFTSLGGWRAESAIFEGENMALEDEDIALELLAANIYRGILRAKSGAVPGVSQATVFNLAAWHNKGNQHQYDENSVTDPKIQEEIRQAVQYGNDVLDHMVQFVEGDCDLGIGRRPVPWSDFKYYNNVEEPYVDTDWAGTKPLPIGNR